MNFMLVSVTDTHISKEKLQETAEIVGAAVYQVARPDTPALERAISPKPVDYERIVGGPQ
ncbi:hypothetical protein [Sporosarcina ureilytica]|uniref:Uncharacterized protein n=1 Tax=Sporosarcina ureilytica TaxID=298596 RepID=A0A1D8JFB1_9BACL|nr:hypothetical protein BI350_07515 [Sporosarcina ureilytica]